MSYNKAETDAIILSQAQVLDNNLNQTYFRNSSNIHPKDCVCDVCKSLRFSDGGAIQENNLKNSLGWFQGDLV